MSNPTANSLFAYDLLGEISIPLMSYDDNTRELKVTAALETVFFPDKINPTGELDSCAPDLVPNVSAFNIRLMNGDRPVTSFIGIVRSAPGYKIRYNEFHDGKIWVDLDIVIDRVETDVRNPNVPDVPIILKDVIIHEGFAALIFGGAYEECVRQVKAHRLFTHCGKVYHAYDAMKLRRQHVADIPAFTVASVVLACETEIPDESGKNQFDSLISDYITRVYQCESTK